jgi:hypothetical protein
MLEKCDVLLEWPLKSFFVSHVLLLLLKRSQHFIRVMGRRGIGSSWVDGMAISSLQGIGVTRDGLHQPR